MRKFSILILLLSGCTPFKQYELKLNNGEYITYNCINYTYQQSNSIETVIYSEFNPMSVKIKDICKKNRGY